MATLQEIRQKHPEYDDLSDADLAGRLHEKFYSDLPRDEFNARIGLQSSGQPQMSSDERGALDIAARARGEKNAETPKGRFGDFLKPVFGGHNPIAETADLVWPEISEEDQAFRDSRGLGERVLDTANFVGSLPVRMLTRGEYGAGDVVGSVVPGAGEVIGQREANFARANAPMLRTIAAAGEAAAAIPPGAGSAMTAGRQAETATQAAYSQRIPAAARAAAEDAAAFDRQGVRPFGPAFSQGPMAATAKQLSEVPVVGAPVRNALEESITGLRDRVNAVADQIAPEADFAQAGSRLQSGLDRFRSAGVSELEPGAVAPHGPVNRAVPLQDRMSRGAADARREADTIRAVDPSLAETQTTRGVTVPPAGSRSQTMTARANAADFSDAEIASFIRAPAADTSFAARQEALYERAFRMIPDMRRVDGSANPNVISAVNTRAALREIDANIANDIAGTGGEVRGALAERLRNPNAGNFSLAQLRAMRTEIGRALSSGNPLQQTLHRTHLNRLYSALSRDIETGLQTLADRAVVRTRVGNNSGNAVDAETARRAAGALRAFRVADRYTRLGMRNIERFIKVVGAESPEAAARTLVRSALDGDRGNVSRFRTVMTSLRPEERNTFSALVLRELGAPAGSARGLAEEIDFSVASFLTRWRNLSVEARRTLFPQEQAAAIDDLVRIAGRLANVEALANTSRSATNAIGLGSVLTGGLSYGTGGLEGLIGYAGSAYGLSVLMSRPSYARWAVRYAELRADALRSPRGAQARIRSHIGTLLNWAGRDPHLATIAAGIAADNGMEAERAD